MSARTQIFRRRTPTADAIAELERTAYHVIPAEEYVSRFARWCAYLAWYGVGFTVALVLS